MTVRVADLRAAYVLPSRTLYELAGEARAIAAVRVSEEARGQPWWEAEQHVEIDFDDPMLDERPSMDAVCSSCGMCCHDLNRHQIRIYMTTAEAVRAEDAGHRILFDPARVMVNERFFHVLAVKPNGDCAMLGPNGCTLGEHRPLWCKMFYCEKALFGGAYDFEPLRPSIQTGEKP